MIYRGEKLLWPKLLVLAFWSVIFSYFTAGLIWSMGKGQIIAAWQIVKGWF